MDIGLYCFIIVVFAALRLWGAKKLGKNCGEKLYTPPVFRTYIWQIGGMAVILAALTGILYLNMKLEMETYMPELCFVLLLGLLAGFCAFSIVLFAFTPVGLYKNGLLTHYLFLEYGDMESYQLQNSNMLNIGRETKTVVFKIKGNTSNHPSIEYPLKDEGKIIQWLESAGIPRAAEE